MILGCRIRRLLRGRLSTEAGIVKGDMSVLGHVLGLKYYGW
jgi:hypothetical protein